MSTGPARTRRSTRSGAVRARRRATWPPAEAATTGHRAMSSVPMTEAEVRHFASELRYAVELGEFPARLEIDGRGADYRRDQLKAYADYVHGGKDFPLVEFRGRHGSASQAVGYGKMLMTAHMLRVLLGELGYDSDLAGTAVAHFQQHRNRVYPYEDVRPVLERLRQDFMLVSLTNGTTEVEKTPLANLQTLLDVN